MPRYLKNRFLAAAVFVALFLIIVGLSALRTEPKVVVIDAWWGRDYAANICKLHTCSDLPDHAFAEFQSRFSAAFATDAACNGITLHRDTDKKLSTDESLKPYWYLSFSIDPANDGPQQWNLIKSADSKNGKPPSGYIESFGTPREIAHDVCSYLKQQGGSLRENR